MNARRLSASLLVLMGATTALLAACTVPPPPPPPPSTTTTTTTAPIDNRGPRGGARQPCHGPEVPTTLPAGLSCRIIPVDGYPREFFQYVPAAVSAAPGTPVPMVLMFHGSSGNGYQFSKISGWKEKADAEGFVALFPTGLEYFVTEDGKDRWSTKWSSYSLAEDIDPSKRLPGYPAGSPWPADDVKFTNMMIDDVASQRGLDTHRVFASGFSNGAAFGSRIANELGDRVAAVGTSGAAAAVHPPSLGPVPADYRPAPIWQALGTKDDRAIEAFGVSPLPLDEAGIMTTPKLSNVLAYNALVYTGSQASCSVSAMPTTTTISWCAPGRPDDKFSMVKDMTHVYPHGYDAGSNPSGVVAANIFWTFFLQHPLP